MKKQLLLITLFISFLVINCSKYETIIEPSTSKSKNTDITSQLFDLNDVPEIKLTVPLKDWNILLSNYDLNKNNKEKVVSHFEFNLNGQTVKLDSIGLRLRGNTSRVRPEGKKDEPHNPVATDWNHFHMGLDFNEFVSGKKFNKLKSLNLKWFKGDASYVRNIYCYDLFERFGVWTAPQASYCRVSIYVEGDSKPAYYGVYAMMEAMDEQYVEKRAPYWGSAVGDLWKCGYAGGPNATFEPTQSIGVEVVTLDGINNQGVAYDLKTNKENINTAKAELSDFIFQINSRSGADFESYIESKMDVSLFLKTYAVNVIVGMWDDYWVNGNNFYFYMGTNGKAYFIPYDYDNTLGTSQIVRNSGTQDPLQWGNQTRPLIDKILAITKYKEAYKGYLKELIDPNKDYFHATKSMARISTWQSKINDKVWNDTNEDMTIKDIPTNWSNIQNYRLLSGDDLGGGSKKGDANFFKSKAKSIYW